MSMYHSDVGQSIPEYPVYFQTMEFLEIWDIGQVSGTLFGTLLEILLFFARFFMIHIFIWFDLDAI